MIFLYLSFYYTGRLRSIIASPSAKLPLISAGGLYPALFAVITSVCGFLVGSLVFGVDFNGVNPGLATLTTLCAMASASCFGLFLSVFGLMNNSMHLVLNVVSYLPMFFTGAAYALLARFMFGFAERCARRNGQSDLF